MTALSSSSCPPTPGQILELSIHALASDGRGIARDQGRVVFSEGTLPGQRVRVRVVSVKKRFVEARLEAVLAPSEDEQPALCSHAEECGGCPWQTLPYARQLFWKQQIVEDALTRIGHLEHPDIRPILPSPEPWKYRNKMSFAFGHAPDGQLTLGQRSRRSRHVIDLTDCHMQDERTMALLHTVRRVAAESGLEAKTDRNPSGFWRFLVVRRPRSGAFVVECIVAGHPQGTRAAVKLGQTLFQAIQDAAIGVNGFVLAQRTAESDVAQAEHILFRAGDTVLQESLERSATIFSATHAHLDLQFDTSSFFQVNTPAAERLYGEVARLLASTRLEDIWDLYCGVGGIGLFIAPLAQAVYGVETVDSAVAMARHNADMAGFSHCCFERGDASLAFARMKKNKAGSRSVVLVDPPRAGLSTSVMDGLLRSGAKHIVYVSCNPATLARDAARLSGTYRLVCAQPVDLFPQTPHVECVTLFQRAAKLSS